MTKKKFKSKNINHGGHYVAFHNHKTGYKILQVSAAAFKTVS